MARRSHYPLTPDEAKERLRVVAHGRGVTPWVRTHPISAMGYAAIGGILLGSTPNLRRVVSRSVIALLPFLLRPRR